MASCSCDRTIKIWDIRADPSKACMITQGNAHFSDVNVIDWNLHEPFIISGGDDGIVKVWDLRNFGGISDPLASFKHHTSPVTSLQWHPDDSTVFASSGADDQVCTSGIHVESSLLCGCRYVVFRIGYLELNVLCNIFKYLGRRTVLGTIFIDNRFPQQPG